MNLQNIKKLKNPSDIAIFKMKISFKTKKQFEQQMREIEDSERDTFIETEEMNKRPSI